jgi:hypothetical protein
MDSESQGSTPAHESQGISSQTQVQSGSAAETGIPSNLTDGLSQNASDNNGNGNILRNTVPLEIAGGDSSATGGITVEKGIQQRFGPTQISGPEVHRRLQPRINKAYSGRAATDSSMAANLSIDDEHQKASNGQETAVPSEEVVAQEINDIGEIIESATDKAVTYGDPAVSSPATEQATPEMTIAAKPNLEYLTSSREDIAQASALPVVPENSLPGESENSQLDDEEISEQTRKHVEELKSKFNLKGSRLAVAVVAKIRDLLHISDKKALDVVDKLATEIPALTLDEPHVDVAPENSLSSTATGSQDGHPGTMTDATPQPIEASPLTNMPEALPSISSNESLGAAEHPENTAVPQTPEAADQPHADPVVAEASTAAPAPEPSLPDQTAAMAPAPDGTSEAARPNTSTPAAETPKDTREKPWWKIF